MIEWGVAALALAPAQGSGDLHVVRHLAGFDLVAVVDGLGHGSEAAAVSKLCGGLLIQHASLSLEKIVAHCHEGLRGTRGVTMSLACFNVGSRTMSWLGVGNVAAILVRASPGGSPAQEFMIQRGGVVGVRVPRVLASQAPVMRGDTLIMATDGVEQGFHAGVNVRMPAQDLAERILHQHAKATDDALVLVARYQGGAW